MAFPGFNNSKKKGTISRGDFDRDGVSNRKDCEPLNFRKQDGGAEFLDVDEYNRYKKKQLKFKGDKKGVANMRKEAKEMHHDAIDALNDSGDWYN